MSVMLDLIGSVVIAGFVILMGLRLNETISGSADATMAGLNVQESMAELVRNLESDFRTPRRRSSSRTLPTSSSAQTWTGTGPSTPWSGMPDPR